MMTPPEINLRLAWIWIWLGFLSGLGLGMFFHRENWLGGYASHKRRLLRLGHISFFGLGFVNLGFYFTAQAKGITGMGLQIASWCLILGAISMPLCCLVMAYRPKSLFLFGVPVVSLLLAGAFTTLAIIQQVPKLQSQAGTVESGVRPISSQSTERGLL